MLVGIRADWESRCLTRHEQHTTSPSLFVLVPFARPCLSPLGTSVSSRFAPALALARPLPPSPPPPAPGSGKASSLDAKERLAASTTPRTLFASDPAGRSTSTEGDDVRERSRRRHGHKRSKKKLARREYLGPYCPPTTRPDRESVGGKTGRVRVRVSG